MENAEHLQWIHDRIINVYGESRNVDFLIRFREIINEQKEVEEGYQKFQDFLEKHNVE